MASNRRKAKPTMITVDPPHWQRALYMVLFAIIAYIILWFLLFLALVQFLLVIINDTENDNLCQFTTRLNAYLLEILAFLSFAKAEVPFPFSPLPRPPET